MSRRNPCLDAAITVLLEHGLSYMVEYGGKHIKLRYSVGGRACCQTVPVSGSDKRGPLNTRGQVRRCIRDAGVGA
jgi:hypothetical protein